MTGRAVDDAATRPGLSRDGETPRRPHAAGLLRATAAVLVASLAAPIIFGALLWSTAALLALGTVGAWRGAPGSVGELIGMTLFAYVLGAPAAVGAGLAAGLPGIWVARRLSLTSLPVFCAGGAALALGCAAWFAHEDIGALRLSRLADWARFAAVAAVTGALCGALCWRIAERRRGPTSTAIAVGRGPQA